MQTQTKLRDERSFFAGLLADDLSIFVDICRWLVDELSMLSRCKRITWGYFEYWNL